MHARHARSGPLARAQGRRERRLRQIPAQADALRQLHGGGGRAGVPRHRRQARAGPADEAVGAARRARQLHPALRHRGAVGHVCRRNSRRRRAQCRAASLREGRAGGRRPRHHRGLAGGADQAPFVRMAARLAVHHSAQCVPPLRQCGELAGDAAMRHVGAERDEPHRQSEFHLQLPAQFHRSLLRRRRLLQAERRHRARSGARAGDAAHQSHSRRDQLRPAARQPPLARLSARRAAHGRQPLLSVRRPARDRPLRQGAQAPFDRGADLRRGQGLHLYVAGCARHDAVAGRQGRQDLAPGLRAGRHGLGGADERRLVPPAFRRQQRAAATGRLARAEQPSRAQGRPPRREDGRHLGDRPQQGRQRHSVSHGRSGHPRGVRGDAAQGRRREPDEPGVLRAAAGGR